MVIHRPLVALAGGHRLVGGWCRFDLVERSTPEGREIVAATDLPPDVLTRLTGARADIAGLSLDRPRVMGILNVTPDSFSDGGRHATRDAALAQSRAMVAAGADILDIGGESTRPGATEVAVAEELERTIPVIEAIRAEMRTPISIDTRKAAVANAALSAGADIVNDVSAMSFDAQMPGIVAKSGAPVCLMHAQGTPETMQRDPRYGDVVRDVIQDLRSSRDAAQAAGIAPHRLITDPGIGFGKTQDHNLTLMAHLSALHDLGAPILFGASRKRFIGTLTGVETAAERVHGSVAAALHAATQGAQILRVHDVAATRQALNVWMAASA
ncbi:MAG: dihydropteroate synthase [Shimia sp.]